MPTADKDRDYERWLNNLSLNDVLSLFREHQAEQLFCKVLQKNNNSKQQIYVGSDISELSWIPSGDLLPVESTSKKDKAQEGPIFHAKVALWWITPSGALEPAKGTKLIAYPQYPEVRFSGFLDGTRQAPSFLLNVKQRGHDPGRLLFLAPRCDGSLLALCTPPESAATRELLQANDQERAGLFLKIPLEGKTARSSLDLLLIQLCRIHRLQWMQSCALNARGIVPCNSSNCGGYTLEANLGIRRNGFAEPDFQGWEVKSRMVPNIDRPGASQVTLFTPEPDGGYYVKFGAKAFIRRWGYPDTKGREDRLNFGGIYRCGGPFHDKTHTRMILDGYNADSGLMKPDGSLCLVDKSDIVAASWSLSKLLDHWKRKHAHAAYVPCQGRLHSAREYAYSNQILLGEGADFRLFMRALADGTIVYDPGIKLENASSPKPTQKLRSQIRVSSTKLHTLYTTMRTVKACGK